MQEVTVRRERGYPWAASNPQIGSALSRGKTSNVQHRTSNAEVSKDSRCHSMFGVGYSMLDVPLVHGGPRTGVKPYGGSQVKTLLDAECQIDNRRRHA